MTAPKVGDRVRVILEGEAHWVARAGTFWVGTNCVDPDAATVVSVRVLDPKEPECHNVDLRLGEGVRHEGQWHTAGFPCEECGWTFTPPAPVARDDSDLVQSYADRDALGDLPPGNYLVTRAITIRRPIEGRA